MKYQGFTIRGSIGTATMPKSRPLGKSAEANPASSESEFSHGLLRVAVAQICRSMGFKGAQQSALEAITDIAARYLKAIAKVATASANTRGRTQSNLFDIIAALEDLTSVQGFPGAWHVGPHSLYAIKDLMNFVKYRDEIPFAQPLPPRRNFYELGRLGEPSDDGRWQCDGRQNVRRHVPNWLPALPVVPEEEAEKEMKWEEGGWGCLNGGPGRGEDDRVRDVAKREGNKEIELGKGKRMKVVFVVGIGGGRVMTGRKMVANRKRFGSGAVHNTESVLARVSVEPELCVNRIEG